MANTITCLKCGYTWTPVKPKPKNCPRCKLRDYHKPKRNSPYTISDPENIAPTINEIKKATAIDKKDFKW